MMSANKIAVCKNQLAPGIQNKVFAEIIIKINFAQAKKYATSTTSKTLKSSIKFYINHLNAAE